ncbi:MAG: SDR family oxidoreductase [Acidobacteriaceae bacterium]|nr:SDR family oxidoreductase [Acidobacteriaceae bacterium]MBV9501670.1 SDR family oxidoreductase [Acidobacteriaceae bacterium]
MSNNQVILITGTSSGFGRLAAETLARRGYRVFAGMRNVADRNAKAAEELGTLAQRENLRLEVLELDVSSDASVESAVPQVLATAGRIDTVINNAGVASNGITEAFSVSEFERVFATNFFGAVRVNRAALPAMRRQRSGLLIHVSSGLGRIVIPYSAPYCSSKFAMEALADCYRFELYPLGIDSVVVEPGAFRSAVFDNALRPSDTARANEYEGFEFTERINATFAATLESSEESPQEVADVFVQLIETPFGERPLRTLVGAGVKKALEGYNQIAEALRTGIAGWLGLDTTTFPNTAAKSQA